MYVKVQAASTDLMCTAPPLRRTPEPLKVETLRCCIAFRISSPPAGHIYISIYIYVLYRCLHSMHISLGWPKVTVELPELQVPAMGFVLLLSGALQARTYPSPGTHTSLQGCSYVPIVWALSFFKRLRTMGPLFWRRGLGPN